MFELGSDMIELFKYIVSMIVLLVMIYLIYR